MAGARPVPCELPVSGGCGAEIPASRQNPPITSIAQTKLTRMAKRRFQYILARLRVRLQAR